MEAGSTKQLVRDGLFSLKTEVKKAYNTFNKAYNLAKMQEGGPESWARTKYPVIDYYKILKKYEIGRAHV